MLSMIRKFQLKVTIAPNPESGFDASVYRISNKQESFPGHGSSPNEAIENALSTWYARAKYIPTNDVKQELAERRQKYQKQKAQTSKDFWDKHGEDNKLDVFISLLEDEYCPLKQMLQSIKGFANNMAAFDTH